MITRILRLSTWQHRYPSIHPSLSCLLPFYTIPIFPLLNRKIFHLLVSFLFLDAHYIFTYAEEYRYIACLCCCFFMPNCLMLLYVCQLSLLIWTSYLDRLPEAICCYLQTYTVNECCIACVYRLSLSLVLIKASCELFMLLLIYCLWLFVVV